MTSGITLTPPLFGFSQSFDCSFQRCVAILLFQHTCVAWIGSLQHCMKLFANKSFRFHFEFVLSGRTTSFVNTLKLPGIMCKHVSSVFVMLQASWCEDVPWCKISFPATRYCCNRDDLHTHTLHASIGLFHAWQQSWAHINSILAYLTAEVSWNCRPVLLVQLVSFILSTPFQHHEP